MAQFKTCHFQVLLKINNILNQVGYKPVSFLFIVQVDFTKPVFQKFFFQMDFKNKNKYQNQEHNKLNKLK